MKPVGVGELEAETSDDFQQQAMEAPVAVAYRFLKPMDLPDMDRSVHQSNAPWSVRDGIDRATNEPSCGFITMQKDGWNPIRCQTVEALELVRH